MSDEHKMYSMNLPKLLTGKGWVKAATISDWVAIDERTVRKLASESNGEVISGDGGYRLTVEATPEEVRHAANRLRSQARQMIERATQIETVSAMNQGI